MEYLYVLIGVACLILGLFISGVTFKKKSDGTIYVYDDPYDDSGDDQNLILQIPDKSVLNHDTIQVKIMHINIKSE